MKSSTGFGMNKILTVVLVLAVAIVAIWLYNKSNSTTVGEHVGEAIDAMPAAVEKAADEVADSETLASAGDAASEALSKAGKATSSAYADVTNDETSSSKKP